MFADWMVALEERHLSDLRFQEVTRALRALSARYVSRRGGDVQRSLDTRGKRAAFALYYAPLHFLATDLVVRALGAQTPAPRSIIDIGCGTGDRKSTRLNSSHSQISYAVFCLKKKKKKKKKQQ